MATDHNLMDRWWIETPAAELPARPWFHPAVTAYLETLLRPTDIVIEHGSGGSTLWLSERVAHVYSVENNLNWYSELKRRNLSNVTLIHSPDGWPLVNIPCDVLIIDGLPLRVRAAWISLVDAIAKPGGIVVLDNANREEYQNERRFLELCCLQHITFNMNTKGSKYLMTEMYLLRGGERWWI